MQVSLKSLDSPKAPTAPKSRKPIAMNMPPPKIQTSDFDNAEPPKGHFYGYMPSELRDNVKNIAIKSMSIPAKNRAPFLHAKLHHSDYINKYLNKYLMVDSIAMMNDHFKFALVYGFNFVETMMMDVTQIHALAQKAQQQQQQQQMRKQPAPEPEKTPLEMINEIKPSD